MNETDLNHHLATTSTRLGLGLGEYYEEDNHNNSTVKRKRSRKTNPAFSTSAEEEAAEELYLRHLSATQEEETLRKGRLVASNIYIPYLGNYKSLNTFINSPSTVINYSSILNTNTTTTTSQQKSDLGIVLNHPTTLITKYFKFEPPIYYPCSSPQDINYTQGTLIFIHKLFKSTENKKLYLFMSSDREGNHSKALCLSRSVQIENNINLTVEDRQDSIFNEFSCWEDPIKNGIVPPPIDDIHQITKGLENYINQHNNKSQNNNLSSSSSSLSSSELKQPQQLLFNTTTSSSCGGDDDDNLSVVEIDTVINSIDVETTAEIEIEHEEVNELSSHINSSSVSVNVNEISILEQTLSSEFENNNQQQQQEQEQERQQNIFNLTPQQKSVFHFNSQHQQQQQPQTLFNFKSQQQQQQHRQTSFNFNSQQQQQPTSFNFIAQQQEPHQTLLYKLQQQQQQQQQSSNLITNLPTREVYPNPRLPTKILHSPIYSKLVEVATAGSCSTTPIPTPNTNTNRLIIKSDLHHPSIDLSSSKSSSNNNNNNNNNNINIINNTNLYTDLEIGVTRRSKRVPIPTSKRRGRPPGSSSYLTSSSVILKKDGKIENINGTEDLGTTSSSSTSPRSKIIRGIIRKRKLSPKRGSDMENKPQFKKGFVIRCSHCGILSPDFITCYRCKKNILPDSAEFPDPFIQFKNSFTPEQVKRRKVYAAPKDEIVVLSSDEETEDKKPTVIPDKIVDSTLTTTTTTTIDPTSIKIIDLKPPPPPPPPPAPPLPSHPYPLQVEKKKITSTTTSTQVSPNTTLQLESSSLIQSQQQQQQQQHKTNSIIKPATFIPPPPEILSPINISELGPENNNSRSIIAPGKMTFSRPSTIRINIPEMMTGPKILSNGTLNQNQYQRETKTSPELSTTPEQTILKIEELLNSSSSSSQFIKFSLRSIRIGSYRITPSHNLSATISEIGILFDIPHSISQSTIRCSIPPDKILNIHAHFNARLQMLVISTTPRYAVWIREKLGMSKDSSMPNFYCPINAGPGQKYIILLPDKLRSTDIAIIKRVYHRNLIEIDFAKANVILMEGIPSDGMITKIIPTMPSYKSSANTTSASTTTTSSSICNNIITTTTPTTTTTPIKTTSTSTTTPRQTRAVVAAAASKNIESEQQLNLEPRVLLNMKISNSTIGMTLHSSDVMCLADEQFLNDQMIDFWLWYKMSNMCEKDRSRTHIFSTFFYNCLTTKPKRRSCAPWENDTKLSIADKRHCRVKKWTKNVDIFSKDFIIIPINESAHWFLAIICFPGVTGICSLEDGTPLPHIKNEDIMKKRRRPVSPEEKEEDPYVDPDRDEEAGNPEEEIQSETDDEDEVGGGDIEKNKIEKDSCQVPNLELITHEKIDRKNLPNIKQPCILIFDSMPNEGGRTKVYATLREYIRVEHKVRKGIERSFKREEMPGYTAKVPDQPNHYDCGIYVLQYVESFFYKPLKSFLLPLPHTLRKWFPNTIVHTKRKEIYEVICELIKTESPENTSYIPELKFNILQQQQQQQQHSPTPSPPPPQLPSTTPHSSKKIKKPKSRFIHQTTGTTTPTTTTTKSKLSLSRKNQEKYNRREQQQQQHEVDINEDDEHEHEHEHEHVAMETDEIDEENIKLQQVTLGYVGVVGPEYECMDVDVVGQVGEGEEEEEEEDEG